MFLFCNPFNSSCASIRSKPPSYTLRWRIENFNWYYSPDGRLPRKDYIDSELFKPEGSNLAFYLRFYPRGNEGDIRDYASLELGLESDSSDVDVILRLTFEIEDGNGQKCFKETVNHNFYQNDRFVCKQFIGLAELDRNKHNLLPKDTLTICCVLEDHEYSNVLFGFTKAESVSKPNILSHIWTIEDFPDYLNGGKMSWKKQLNSQPFSTSDGNLEFHLSLYPNVRSKESKDYISVYLVHLNKKSEVKFNCALFLVDANGTKLYIQVKTNYIFSKSGLGYTEYISHVDLLNPQNNNKKLIIGVNIEDVGNELIRRYNESSCCTEINALSHIWTIENFTDYLADGKLHWKNRLYSEVLSTKDGNYEFNLGLSPCGHSDDTRKHVSIYLHQKKGENFEFNFVLSIIDADGKRTNIRNFTNHLKVSRGFSKYISHRDLLNPQNNYLPQNKLTIGFNIEDVGNELIRGYNELSCYTEINALSHIWTIENFTDYLAGGKLHWKNRLYSEVLSTKDGNYEFYLDLFPCGFSDDTRNNVSIFCHQKKGENIIFNFVLSIIDADGKRENIWNFTNHLTVAHGYSEYISHIDLLNPQNNYLPQNKLTIAFNIEDVDHKVIHDYHEIFSTTKPNCHVHNWTIENFSSLGTGLAWKLGFQSWINSNTFSVSNRKNKFYLRLYPNGGDDKEYISLFLLSCKKSEIVFNCTFVILGNGVSSNRKFCHKFIKDNADRGYSRFISRADLLNSKNGYLSNNKLTIKCVISDQNEELIRGYTETCSVTNA